ncbi:hypothetical protein Rsub_08770 [Raphidocelis subcapitata]|uniref:Uncharacterized protein n=1 Tax=Raphidocelis subcapitata TaxID=307507 RepID=A0A2V0PGN2_9CHLO|nr:hypothetical protein Rsub_08770 [Raphidocelis subcapitata]|eukprot:GBF96225.1 hypothetical protein Rsub_08770 [Raphidocelis subcapitata]
MRGRATRAAAAPRQAPARRAPRPCAPLGPLALLLLLAAPARPSSAAPAATAPAAAERFSSRALRSALAVELLPAAARAPATLVTAAFSADDAARVAGLLGAAEAPVVVFASETQLPRLQALRGGRPAVYVAYDSIWDVPPARHYRPALEAARAGAALAACGPWFLAVAAGHDPFESGAFVWVAPAAAAGGAGAGAPAAPPAPSWPSAARVEAAVAACGRDDCVVLAEAEDEAAGGAAAAATPPDAAATWRVDAGAGAAAGPGGAAPPRPALRGDFVASKAAGALWWAADYYALLDDHLALPPAAGSGGPSGGGGGGGGGESAFWELQPRLLDGSAVRNYWRTALLPAARLRAAGCAGAAFWGALAGEGAAGGCPLQLEKYQGIVDIERRNVEL